MNNLFRALLVAAVGGYVAGKFTSEHKEKKRREKVVEEEFLRDEKIKSEL